MLKNNYFLIGGKNSVTEVIKKKPNTVNLIICTKPLENEVQLILKDQKKNLKILVWEKTKIDKLFEGNFNHQGIACSISKNFINKKYILDNTVKDIVIFEELYDLRNIGSIIRSGLAFNIKNYFFNKKNLGRNFEKIYKTSSGYAASINAHEYNNLSNLLINLKDKGFWIVGLENSSQSKSIYKFQWPEKSAIVIGNEHYGLKKLTRSKCDFLLKIPISNEVESLNVANAFSIVVAKKNAPF